MSDIIQCVSCHKKFHIDGFRTDRLGNRLKSCIECRERYTRQLDKRKRQKEALKVKTLQPKPVVNEDDGWKEVLERINFKKNKQKCLSELTQTFEECSK